MKTHWLIGGLAGVFALGGLAFVQGGDSQGGEGAAAQAEVGQPIAFPHDRHAGSQEGQNNMDCMYCHFSAERSKSAGVPSVQSCWGCHQVIPGQTEQAQQEIAR
ncbi:MAG: cytochrome c3 family protein, partial [Longimicrobiales bacterium]|nr:cytochrome c3 family protein [Longimicrobiales bacterium]